MKALTGEASTDFRQVPHRCFTAIPVGLKGALVSKLAHLTLGPWSGVMSMQLFPIHPSPARCAAILWEKIAHILSPSEWWGVDYHLYDLSPEERDWFFRAYIGEMWMITIRAFNDLYGKEGTLRALAPRMRADGMSLGAHLSMEHPGLEPKDAVLMVMRCLRQKVSDWDDGGGFEVNKWTFSSQPDVCALLEAFLDGLCDALRAGSGYYIMQKMTDDASSCRSKVR